ncbi:hypothetical protein [[Mycobacterium] burgundiense]|uniref:Uncharacterized protein n=1 Tax=[Mycobacterium] burgundiense TaxID=3064286 RepID=A0ABN9NFM1_9MYCO|nr:hypothetical protein [Mycolicibacterium sp. MU0053]CAJ1505544.1 hypothetical protein MU0053_002962 [Mycolicibacterium sp. MU0053]
MTDDEYPDQATREQLCGVVVSLDGYAARVSGWGQPVAEVSWRDGPGYISVAWRIVARVVEAGGDFHSDVHATTRSGT